MTHDALEMNATSELLAVWLGTLKLGAPARSGALTVIPVYCGKPMRTVAYRTLPEAIAMGEVLVAEHSSATVPMLQVINTGVLPVLILDGEEVAGGRQNRVVNTTLLILAKTTFDLPVSCIEHGRWHEEQVNFDAGEAVHPSLRRQKIEQVSASFLTSARPVANQAAVWAEVEASHRRTGTRSATAALRDAYVQRADELAEAERDLPYPEDNPSGVVALVEGRALCADLFDRPETLRLYWSRLVRSYAMEAIHARSNAEPRLDSARRLLARPLKAVRTPFASPGLGTDVRIAGNGVVGAALVHDGTVLHTALFRRHQTPANGNMRSPGERARHLER